MNIRKALEKIQNNEQNLKELSKSSPDYADAKQLVNLAEDLETYTKNKQNIELLSEKISKMEQILSQLDNVAFSEIDNLKSIVENSINAETLTSKLKDELTEAITKVNSRVTNLVGATGSGEVWLKNLDDVDRNTVASPQDNQVLAYDSAIGKWRATNNIEVDVDVDLGQVSQDIVPSADETYDLGSASNKWKDLYLSGSTLRLGDVEFKSTAEGDVEIKRAITSAHGSAGDRVKIKIKELDSEVAVAGSGGGGGTGGGDKLTVHGTKVHHGTSGKNLEKSAGYSLTGPSAVVGPDYVTGHTTNVGNDNQGIQVQGMGDIGNSDWGSSQPWKKWENGVETPVQTQTSQYMIDYYGPQNVPANYGYTSNYDYQQNGGPPACYAISCMFYDNPAVTPNEPGVAMAWGGDNMYGINSQNDFVDPNGNILTSGIYEWLKNNGFAEPSSTYLKHTDSMSGNTWTYWGFGIDIILKYPVSPASGGNSTTPSTCDPSKTIYVPSDMGMPEMYLYRWDGTTIDIPCKLIGVADKSQAPYMYKGELLVSAPDSQAQFELLRNHVESGTMSNQAGLHGQPWQWVSGVGPDPNLGNYMAGYYHPDPANDPNNPTGLSPAELRQELKYWVTATATASTVYSWGSHFPDNGTHGPQTIDFTVDASSSDEPAAIDAGGGIEHNIPAGLDFTYETFAMFGRPSANNETIGYTSATNVKPNTKPHTIFEHGDSSQDMSIILYHTNNNTDTQPSGVGSVNDGLIAKVKSGGQEYTLKWNAGFPIGNLYDSIVSAGGTWDGMMLNRFYHIALQRKDDTLALIVDGEVKDSTTHTGAINFSENSGSAKIVLGNKNTPTLDDQFVGSLDQFRFSKKARYAHTGFTPPGARFLNDDATFLLIDSTQHSGSQYFRDVSQDAHLPLNVPTGTAETKIWVNTFSATDVYVDNNQTSGTVYGFRGDGLVENNFSSEYAQFNAVYGSNYYETQQQYYYWEGEDDPSTNSIPGTRITEVAGWDTGQNSVWAFSVNDGGVGALVPIPLDKASNPIYNDGNTTTGIYNYQAPASFHAFKDDPRFANWEFYGSGGDYRGRAFLPPRKGNGTFNGNPSGGPMVEDMIELLLYQTAVSADSLSTYPNHLANDPIIVYLMGIGFRNNRTHFYLVPKTTEAKTRLQDFNQWYAGSYAIPDGGMENWSMSTNGLAMPSNTFIKYTDADGFHMAPVPAIDVLGDIGDVDSGVMPNSSNSNSSYWDGRVLSWSHSSMKWITAQKRTVLEDLDNVHSDVGAVSGGEFLIFANSNWRTTTLAEQGVVPYTSMLLETGQIESFVNYQYTTFPTNGQNLYWNGNQYLANISSTWDTTSNTILSMESNYLPGRAYANGTVLPNATIHEKYFRDKITGKETGNRITLKESGGFPLNYGPDAFPGSGNQNDSEFDDWHWIQDTNNHLSGYMHDNETQRKGLVTWYGNTATTFGSINDSSAIEIRPDPNYQDPFGQTTPQKQRYNNETKVGEFDITSGHDFAIDFWFKTSYNADTYGRFGVFTLGQLGAVNGTGPSNYNDRGTGLGIVLHDGNTSWSRMMINNANGSNVSLVGESTSWQYSSQFPHNNLRHLDGNSTSGRLQFRDINGDWFHCLIHRMYRGFGVWINGQLLQWQRRQYNTDPWNAIIPSANMEQDSNGVDHNWTGITIGACGRGNNTNSYGADGATWMDGAVEGFRFRKSLSKSNYQSYSDIGCCPEVWESFGSKQNLSMSNLNGAYTNYNTNSSGTLSSKSDYWFDPVALYPRDKVGRTSVSLPSEDSYVLMSSSTPPAGVDPADHVGFTWAEFGPPKMTTAERDAKNYTQSQAGAIIYNTTTNKFQGLVSDGTTPTPAVVTMNSGYSWLDFHWDDDGSATNRNDMSQTYGNPYIGFHNRWFFNHNVHFIHSSGSWANPCTNPIYGATQAPTYFRSGKLYWGGSMVEMNPALNTQELINDLMAEIANGSQGVQDAIDYNGTPGVGYSQPESCNYTNDEQINSDDLMAVRFAYSGQYWQNGASWTSGHSYYGSSPNLQEFLWTQAQAYQTLGASSGSAKFEAAWKIHDSNDSSVTPGSLSTMRSWGGGPYDPAYIGNTVDNRGWGYGVPLRLQIIPGSTSFGLSGQVDLEFYLLNMYFEAGYGNMFFECFPKDKATWDTYTAWTKAVHDNSGSTTQHLSDLVNSGTTWNMQIADPSTITFSSSGGNPGYTWQDL
tara:strand:- start:6776 stop:13372 length:6597 start_codon:yes stop_codon:yes gene_type:complete